MIAFVDSAPQLEAHGDGFLVSVKSGDSETKFLLTLHALSGLSRIGALLVKEAHAKAAVFEPTPFQRRAARRK